MILVTEGILAIVLLFIFPTIIGGIIKYYFIKNKGNEPFVSSLTFSFVFGYLAEFALFQIIGVPLILLGASFTVMVWCFVIWNIILSLYSIYINYLKDRRNSSIKKDFSKWMENIKVSLSNKTTLILAIVSAILIGFQIYIPTVCMHEDDDDIFYVGTAVTSIYENTMFKVNPRTGEEQGFEWKYVLGPFPLYNAVISKLIHIHPTITAHTILPSVFILLCYGVYYLIGKKLFKNDENSVLLFMIFMSFLNLFGNYSIRTSSTFLMFRIWQGKAMLANYIIPIFWLLWMLQEDNESRFSYFLYVMAILAGMFTTSMGNVFPPMILGILAFIRLVKERDFKRFMKTVLCCIPIGLYCSIYVINILIGLL